MRCNAAIILAALVCMPALCCKAFAAEAPEGMQDGVEALKRKLAQVQAALDEADRRHEAQIRELAEKLRALESRTAPAGGEQDAEMESLRKLAAQEAEKDETADEEPEQTVFEALGLNLQDLNPELSVTGDMVGLYRQKDGVRSHSDFDFRCLGIHFESYLDPYTKFKAAVPVNEDGAELEEAYLTRFSVLETVNLSAGKFRQQFGVVNRWHTHALDQVEFPVAMRHIFGPEGLNQTGVSIDWSMPSMLGSSQSLICQVTNGENSRLFSGNRLSIPSVLVRYGSYRDLSHDVYLDLGLTGLAGWNDEWTAGAGRIRKSLSTRVYGADMSVVWEPAGAMRYRNIEWRSEAYVLDRDLYAPDGSGRDSLLSWGFYSYVQTLFERVWTAGVRFDFYKPDRKGYASSELAPLAYADGDAFCWQIGPYITWQQSPYVRVRLEYDHIDGIGMDGRGDVVMLQAIFAAGPHKHDRY